MDRCLNETPPAALVLLVDAKSGGGQFLGHARICPLPGPSDHQSQRCWVESVVVWRALRGKGIGQILMEKIEEYSRNLGYGEVYPILRQFKSTKMRVLGLSFHDGQTRLL